MVHLSTFSPCKGCEARRSACHDGCEPYKAWKAEVDRIHANERHEKDLEAGTMRHKPSQEIFIDGTGRKRKK